ncbi:O-antigen ligase family protein [Lachnospiraceae bacterium MD1]|uniref:O-antigen ligase family protein n=1 Tax=Variimorphobacter saccharofermentans TaxID=2755051 RepID=A0A839JZV4_9FIRM|nr:O-antigen ligase family protein [Variimorphobacter saccharofermentans]MBB2183205.1 O-antigen ligase family protein [Variimorphobacter saccharofermentans]
MKHRIDLSLTNTNMVVFATAAIFLPYILSGIILISIAIYIIWNKDTRQLVFIHPGSGIIKCLFTYMLFISFLYQNWIGLLAAIGICLAIVFAFYMRSVMTKELYEQLLTFVCGLSLTSAGYAITEAVISYFIDGRHNHRISSVFFHPNYFGTIVGTVIIICAYKFLTIKKNKHFYLIVACVNVINMYLCKSMFVWVEVFVGITILLIALKKYRLLALWLSAALLAGILIFGLNFQLIPRLSVADVTFQLRKQVWRITLREIKKAPLLGHGPMSFYFLTDVAYRNQIIPHAHSLYLDTILNYGIIGFALISYYCVKNYKAYIKSCLGKKNITSSYLVLAVIGATLVHGLTDITILWVQTLPLLMLVLSGQGVVEKETMVDYKLWVSLPNQMKANIMYPFLMNQKSNKVS